MRRIRLCLIRLSLAILLFTCALTAHAQGCSMCRDTTAGAAPQIRAGLRKAIPILAIPALALFLTFFVVARRTDTGKHIDGPCQDALTPHPIDGQSR